MATLAAIPLTVSLAGATPGTRRAAPLTSPFLAAGPVPGTSCASSCDLWAETGTMPAASLPGAPPAGIPVWGYSTTNVAATAPGGPTLVVNQGDAVSITLHNSNIPSATSLMIAGQPVVPDTAGVTTGSSKTYTFASGTLQPGTYLYEAGLTADGPRQAAMGLYGALIVRPTGAPSQAYADPSTAFNDEAVLVLSEIDPALNAAPSTFDMTTYAPKFWLINGKVYPNTDPITTAAGDNVLLRYVNAGLKHHSMSLLGLHQTIVAKDAQFLTNPSKVVSETIPTGTTLDALVTMPNPAPASAKYVVYDAAMRLDNAGAATGGVINFGGMLTLLTVGTGTVTAGPVTSAVTVNPNPTNGSVPGTLTATISGGPDVAEYFVDTIAANGAGCPLTGSLTSVSVTIPASGATAPCADLATLASGNHTFYVHGHDVNGWGAVASAVLNLDKTGPLISNMVVTPTVDNGTADVQLQATASDVATGNQNVIAAEYTIDGGTANAITVTIAAPVVSLTATIPAATVNGLSDGNHAIAVRAQDGFGNWGAYGTVTLKVDKTSPVASAVSAQPNPNNGTLGVQISSGGTFYVRIDATVADPLGGTVNSNIVGAEYFFDAVGANGSGGTMIPTDGAFNTPTEVVYGAVDLIHIAALAQGQHTIYVHGKDTAGNWGPMSTTTFIVDKTSPAISALSTTPAPANLAASVTVNVTAADPANTGTPVNAPASNITGGEYFWGPTDPGVGNATTFAVTPAASGTFTTPIDVSQRTIFTNNTLSVRVKDAAGNWSTASSTVVAIDRIFANSFPAGAAPYGWSATGGTAARLSLNAGANIADASTSSLAATVAGGTSAYVVNTLPAGQTSYDARFYVNPNGATLGSATPTIFAAMNGGTTVFSVQMRLSGGNYQVRVVGTASSAWYTITGPTAIEVARAGSTLTLFTGGTPRPTVSVATTNITAARLGLSAGVTAAMNGRTIYFDGFVSSRTTHIGP